MKDDIREQFKELIQKMGLLEEQQTKCCDLSLVQCHVLTEVGNSEGLSVNDLSIKLNLDKSTTSRHITNLVKSGLINRLENPTDRRYFTLSLTESGTETYSTINDTMDGYYDQLLKSLSMDQQQQISDALGLISEAINQLGCC